MRVLRHLLAIAVLPFTVAVLVPGWIARDCGVVPHLDPAIDGLLVQGFGVFLVSTGLALASASLRRFAGEGKGTLAPWDPPKRFVAGGPYQYVRNPMITGIVLVLFGEACVFRSLPHGVWAAAFLALNGAYIPWVEEPQLERRFGEPYREYCRHVGRFVPRTRPWKSPNP